MKRPSPTIVATLLVVLVAAAIVVFWNARFERDFYVLWVSAKGAVAGITPYDEVAQAAYITNLLGKHEPLEFLPFGYPPWFVLLTLYLAALPLEAAGRLWFCLNLGMLLGTWGLLTHSWSRRPRLVGVLAVALFVPALGLLRVGQFALPVMFGAALFVRGAESERPWWVAAGLFAMSFKPHLGAPLFLACSAWLLIRTGEPWVKRSFARLGIIFLGLGLLSFSIAPRWPVSYPASVFRLATSAHNTICDSCSTLAWEVGRRALDGNANVAALAIFLIGMVLIVRSRTARSEPRLLVSAVLLLSMLGLPYLRNYDFAVMVLPMLVAWEYQGSHRLRALGIALAWALPAALLVLPRGEGAGPLWFSAVVLFDAILAPPPAELEGSS